MDLRTEFIVKPGQKVRIEDFDPAYTAGLEGKEHARRQVEKNIARLAELQYRLYAENRRALLVVLQGMDASGKDGAIRHVMSGVNPQGCRVTSFKVPSAEELAHDFLWRIHKAVPERGQIGIFNRSQYEDVLVVRVHGLVGKAVWSKRYEQINRFERHLADNAVTILKFFLNISKDEQKRRFQDRLDDPSRLWKVNPRDFDERRLWDDYMDAYQDALGKCSRPQGPWFVVPANHKWFRDLAVSSIIVRTLEEMDPQFPKPTLDPATVRLE